MVVKITKGTKPSFETIDKGKFRSRHAASSAFGYSRTRFSTIVSLRVDPENLEKVDLKT